MSDIPVQLFDGPFYKARKAFDNGGPAWPDPLDTRPGGTKVTDTTLKRLVTFAARAPQTDQFRPPKDDIHLTQIARYEHAIHQDLVLSKTDAKVIRGLKRNIRHWFALKQERATKTIIMPEQYLRALGLQDSSGEVTA